VVFAVSDTGIGIAPEDQELIFEEFGQIESHLQRRVKGTGLGLPLSRRLAELLGGRVSVQSTVGVGSTFSLVIPRHYSSGERARLAPGRDHPINPATASTVLLIDDDEVSRYLLRNLVNEIHPTILEAASGLEGLREAKECQPGAIFLDLVMPDLSGFEVLDRLKADPTTRNIPVIVYTSQVLDDSAQARLAGAVAILSKGGSMPREAAARAIRTALVKAGWPEGIANE